MSSVLHVRATRREFLGVLTASALAGAASDWIELFDGKTLDGWRPSENKGSWKVREGALAADGPRSHLFYTGPVHGADFRNFELEVELLTRPECNSGVYFHTRYQESGFPEKGFEIQVNNTALGEGTYRERKKTGSLYGLRNIYKQFVPDDQWFKIHAAVRGKNVRVHVNGMLLVDYVEPTRRSFPRVESASAFLTMAPSRCSATTTDPRRSSEAFASGRCRAIYRLPASQHLWWTPCIARSSTSAATTFRWWTITSM